MPLMAALLSGLLTAIADLFIRWFGKKAAFGMAAVGVFSAVTVALYGLLAAILNGMVPSLPSWPGVQIAAWVAVPPALPGAVSAVVGAEAAIALYRWNVQNLKILSGVS